MKKIICAIFAVMVMVSAAFAAAESIDSILDSIAITNRGVVAKENTFTHVISDTSMAGIYCYSNEKGILVEHCDGTRFTEYVLAPDSEGTHQASSVAMFQKIVDHVPALYAFTYLNISSNTLVMYNGLLRDEDCDGAIVNDIDVFYNNILNS